MLLFAYPSPAGASGGSDDTSRLHVHVVLAAPRSGPAVVSMTTASDPGREWTARLNDADVATFSGLVPGVYAVRVDAPGASTASLDVPIGAQETVTLRATPAAGQGASRLEVADRQRIGEGATFESRWLRDLPTAQNVWNLVETAAPFVVVDRIDTGGSGTGRSGLMGSRGASWLSSSITFGDVHVRDIGRTGLFTIVPDLHAVSAVAVSSGIAPIEIATPGVVVSMVLERPGPKRRGLVQASATTRGLVATNALPDAPSITRLNQWREFGGTISNPIGARAGVVVAASTAHADWVERGAPFSVAARESSVVSHLVANPTSRNQVRAIAAFQGVAHPFDGRLQFADRRVRESAGFWQSQATWDRVAGPALQQFSVGYQRSSRDPDLGSTPIGGTIERTSHGIVPDLPATIDITRWDARAILRAPDRRWGGAHHGVRLGATFSRATTTSRLSALPAVAESVGGLPARVWVPVAPTRNAEHRLDDVGVFVADRILMGPSLTMEAGVRLDATRGRADGAETGLSWATVSPRLSVTWSPGRFSVFGGLGRYAAPHAASLLSFGDPGEPWRNVFRWEDADGDGAYTDDERGVLVARAGRGQGVAAMDGALRSPISREATIGLEYRQGTRMRLRGALIIRRESDLVASVNVGVVASDYRVRLVPDQNSDYDSPADDRLLPVFDRLPAALGRDAFLLTNPDGARATYDGIEIGWELTSARWHVIFGATAYKTSARGANRGFGPLENDQHVVGELFELPNAFPEEPGRTFFDRAYVGKWAGSYHVTPDLRIAFAARYQDGQPFTRVVVVPDLTMGPDLVQAYRMGQTRFTYTFTLDTRVEKTWTIGGAAFALRLDVFNLTNHRNEVEEDVVTGPTFRRSTAVQPPLTLRAGLRIGF